MSELREVVVMGNRGVPMYPVAIMADGGTAITGDEAGDVRVWGLNPPRELHVLKGHKGSVGCIAVMADGKHIVTGGSDGTERIWELGTGRQVAWLSGQLGDDLRT